MAIPPRSRIPPRGDLRHFPPTNGPVLLLAPDRRSIGIYQVPQNTVVFFQPQASRVPPQPPAPEPPTPPPPFSIGNTAQTCTSTCPDGTTGDPIVITVDAGEFFRSSLEAANAAAMASACAQAEALRLATPCVVPPDTVICGITDCRTKPGTATLFGCAEFGTPSVPPKFYLTLQMSGNVLAYAYFAPPCTGPAQAGSVTCEYTKFRNYNQATGAVTTGGNTTCNTDGVISIDTTAVDCVGWGPSCGQEYVVQSTTQLKRISQIGFCCFDGALYIGVQSDTLEVNLDNEDTPQAAMERAVIGVPWTEGICDTNTAQWEMYSGREFDFVLAQFRLTIGTVDDPLTPGYTYFIEVTFVRRVYGTAGPFLPYATAQVELVAGGTTQISDWIDIPNDPGFETKVSSCAVVGVAP